MSIIWKSEWNLRSFCGEKKQFLPNNLSQPWAKNLFPVRRVFILKTSHILKRRFRKRGSTASPHCLAPIENGSFCSNVFAIYFFPAFILFCHHFQIRNFIAVSLYTYITFPFLFAISKIHNTNNVFNFVFICGASLLSLSRYNANSLIVFGDDFNLKHSKPTYLCNFI